MEGSTSLSPHLVEGNVPYLLRCVEAAWGGSNDIDDKGKAVLAGALLCQAAKPQRRKAMPLNEAGSAIRDVLGDAWLSSEDRKRLGLPSLHKMLTDDRRFIVSGHNTSISVRLNLVELTKAAHGGSSGNASNGNASNGRSSCGGDVAAPAATPATAAAPSGGASSTQPCELPRDAMLRCIRELWGRSDSVDDAGKQALAEALVAEMTAPGGGVYLTLSDAGTLMRDALGARWQAKEERLLQGQPTLKQLLFRDSRFRLGTVGADATVSLNLPVWAGLVDQAGARGGGSNGEEGGREGAGWDPGGGSGGGVSPERPCAQECAHYMAHGWCKSQQKCHYEYPGPGSKGPSAADAAPGQGTGTLAVAGKLAQRPGEPACPFYLQYGWCGFQAACRYDHPVRGGAGDGTSNSAGHSDDSSRRTPRPAAGTAAAPSPLMLAMLVANAVWSPLKGGKEAFLRGALAKHILKEFLVPGDVVRETYTLLMSKAGHFLHRAWSRQKLYSTHEQAYGSLRELLEGDPYLEMLPRQGSDSAGSPKLLALNFRRLVTNGAPAAAALLCGAADLMWPPEGGRDCYLHGALVKHILVVTLSPEGIMRALGPAGAGGARPMFCTSMASAAFHLKGLWEAGGHPFDPSEQPWTAFKQLVAGEPLLSVVGVGPDIVLDVQSFLERMQSMRSAPRDAPQPAVRTAGEHSGGGGAAARVSPRVSPVLAGVPGWRTRGPISTVAAFAALTAPDDEVPSVDSRPGSRSGSGGGSSLQDLVSYSPNGPDTTGRSPAAAASPVMLGAASGAAEAAGGGPSAPGATTSAPSHPRPAGKAAAGLAPVGVAVKLVADEAGFVEMLQHLELCEVMAVGCTLFAGAPQLLTFFAPYASMYNLLVMPATVYILDMANTSKAREWMSGLKPILESRSQVKLTHSSRQWSGLLDVVYGISLRAYIDTQQLHHVICAIRCQLRNQSTSHHHLQGTDAISIASVMQVHRLYHPVRHEEQGTTRSRRKWQVRPLTANLVECAAADVAYIIPVFEAQAAKVSELVRQLRASPMSSTPPPLYSGELTGSALDELARGVEGGGGGGLDPRRLVTWSGLSALHQLTQLA